MKNFKFKKFLAVIFALVMIIQTGCVSKEEQAEKAKKLTRGVWAGSVFLSDFAGLTFTLPAGWQTDSDEEIAALIGIAREELSSRGTAVSDEMLDFTSIYDMFAINPNTGESVALMYQNLAMNIGGTLLTESTYLEAVKKGIEDAPDLAFTLSDIGDATIAGETFKSFEGSNSDYGVQQAYYARKIGNFMLSIIVTAGINDTGAIERITANFSELKPNE